MFAVKIKYYQLKQWNEKNKISNICRIKSHFKQVAVSPRIIKKLHAISNAF